MAKGLTVFAIKAAKAKARATGQRVPKGDGRGLFYIALPSGDDSWVQHVRVHGEQVKVTNKEPGLGIAGARKWSATIREKAARGIDPREETKAAKAKAQGAAANTLRAIADVHLDREEKAKRLRTIGQRRATLERLVYPRLGDRPIADIKRSEIIRLLDQVEDDRGARRADEDLATVRRIMAGQAARDDQVPSPIVAGR